MSSFPLSVRLPDPVRERLAIVAAAERRSVSGMARVLVEDGLALRDRDRAAQTLKDLGYRVRDDES
jgi:predicted transcriptional regulator